MIKVTNMKGKTLGKKAYHQGLLHDTPVITNCLHSLIVIRKQVHVQVNQWMNVGVVRPGCLGYKVKSQWRACSEQHTEEKQEGLTKGTLMGQQLDGVMHTKIQEKTRL